MQRNKRYSVIKMAIAGTLAGTLAACGGGSGSGNETSASAGGSVGPVSGFGSVYVNGTHFNINGASYSGNDGIDRESLLEKGMILRVSGTWQANGEGDASDIYYDDTLRGPVSKVTWDPTTKAGTITLAGFEVAFNSQTVFKGATAEQLKAGVTSSTEHYRVRISGWRMDDGSFVATYVGAKEMGSGWTGDWNKVEVEGLVSKLDAEAKTFSIGNLTVNYNGQVEFDDGSEGDLKDGTIVEVEGTLKTDPLELTASEIDFEKGLFNNDDDVEISGAITGAYNADTRKLQLNGFDVLVDDDTELDDDLNLEYLTEGTEIKVEGEYRNGIIVAEELETREGDAELSGMIQSKEQGGEVLMVGGVRVTLTNSTLIEDDDTQDSQESVTMRSQDLQSLTVGDYIEIEGRETAENGGGLIAFHIERDSYDEGDYLKLEGRISSVADASVTVMGLELPVASGSSVNLAGLTAGDAVEVQYSYDETSNTYALVSIEKDD
jgi:hypothetical protein